MGVCARERGGPIQETDVCYSRTGSITEAMEPRCSCVRVRVVPEALAYTVCVVHACSPSHALVVDVVATSSIVPGASLKE